MRRLRLAAELSGAVLLLLLAAGFGALRSSPPLAVLVRNTPQLDWLQPALGSPPALDRLVAPTAGDPSLTGALYRPRGRPGATAVLLVNGVEVPGGWQNPDIARFAQSIADLGHVVYVPDLPGGLELGTVTPETAQALEADINWLRAGEDGRPVSLVGVCVGASLGLVAAEQQPADVSAVIGLDPYASLRDLLLAATTGTGPDASGEEAPFTMAPWVARDLARSVILTLPDADARKQLDQALLAGMADDPLAAFDTGTPDGLSPGAQAPWRLLGNRDPGAFARLYAALPPTTQTELEQLSPLPAMGRLTARVLLAAPNSDFAFPAGEASLLARANPGQVHLIRSSALDHVSPEFGPQLLGGYWRLWQFASQASALMG